MSLINHWKQRKSIISAKTLSVFVNANVVPTTYLSNYEARFHNWSN